MNFSRIFLPALLLAILATLFLQTKPLSAPLPGRGPFYLDAYLASTADCEAVLSCQGPGAPPVTASVQLKKSTAPLLYRFEVLRGTFDALLLAFGDPEADVLVGRMQMSEESGKSLLNISPQQFLVASGGATIEKLGETVKFKGGAGKTEPMVLRAEFMAPVVLWSLEKPRWSQLVLQFAISLGIATGLTVLCDRLLKHYGSLAKRAGASPRAAVAICALIAVILGCYPIIFSGKSFVSPANGANALYDKPQNIPGEEFTRVEDQKGSDVGATMWAHLPYSVVEHRAIFEHGELPLWIRENSCGIELLGQGLSMIGDPLHWLCIVAKGAAWAWDVKFLAAKWLFAFGIGLCVLAITSHLPSALLLCVSSVFIGFFSYRFNHAAFFSLCYAPWILLCWLNITRCDKGSKVMIWAASLIAANWIELNSGTAKESAMLLIFMNLSGGLVLLLSASPLRSKLIKLGVAVWFSSLFLLLSAPVWLVFLSSLRGAYTLSDARIAYQIQPGLFIGLFEDLFYRQITNGITHFNPSANFLVLLGVLWSVAARRQLVHRRAWRGLMIGAVLPLALAFGIIPSNWITAAPILGNIVHIDNTFSCVLIVQFLIIAGIGIHRCMETRSMRVWNTECKAAALWLGVLLSLYLGFVHAAHRIGLSMLKGGRQIPLSFTFVAYELTLIGALLLLVFTLRRFSVSKERRLLDYLLLGLSLVVIHFRYGMYNETKFDNYVMNPQPRTDLLAPSAAVSYILGNQQEPSRTMGFGMVLVPGFNAALGLEGLSSAEALINPRYHELLDASGMPRMWEWRVFLDKNKLAQWHRFADMMNVGFYLSSQSDAPRQVPGLELTASSRLNVYRSPTVWPRAFFTDSVIPYERIGDFAKLVNEGDGKPFAAVQAADARGPLKELAKKGLPERVIIPASNYHLTANKTSFAIEAARPGLVVLSETFYDKNSTVTINGVVSECIRLNGAFKGVFLEKAGSYIIQFGFWPHVLTTGLQLAGLGFLGFMASWILLRRVAGMDFATLPAIHV